MLIENKNNQAEAFYSFIQMILFCRKCKIPRIKLGRSIDRIINQHLKIDFSDMHRGPH